MSVFNLNANATSLVPGALGAVTEYPTHALDAQSIVASLDKLCVTVSMLFDTQSQMASRLHGLEASRGSDGEGLGATAPPVAVDKDSTCSVPGHLGSSCRSDGDGRGPIAPLSVNSVGSVVQVISPPVSRWFLCGTCGKHSFDSTYCHYCHDPDVPLLPFSPPYTQSLPSEADS